MNMIAVIGGSGYIGRYLIEELAKTNIYDIKVLTRLLPEKSNAVAWPENVEVIKGDLQDTESLHGFLEPGCTVVNLAYLWHAGESGNLAAMRNLLNACKEVQVRRLIHCSTSIVVGSVSASLVTENTECKPMTEYETTKLKVEHNILDAARRSFDSVVLRPTSVFGPDAPPLRKLTDDLVGGNRYINYLKSCFLGRRRMNLIPIENVIAAILFMIGYQDDINGEIFIVSNDDEVGNNFANIECTLINKLKCKGHIIAPIPLPHFMLTLALKLFGKKAIRSSYDFSPSKLKQFGFINPITFEEGLIEYTDWYQSTFLKPTERAAT